MRLDNFLPFASKTSKQVSSQGLCSLTTPIFSSLYEHNKNARSPKKNLTSYTYKNKIQYNQGRAFSESVEQTKFQIGLPINKSKTKLKIPIRFGLSKTKIYSQYIRINYFLIIIKVITCFSHHNHIQKYSRQILYLPTQNKSK